MPVGPRLHPGATLHYKTRIKTWSDISFLLSLSHNSYDTNWAAQPFRATRGIMICVAKANA